MRRAAACRTHASAGSAFRSYTDYKHHDYPMLKSITVFMPLFVMAAWISWFSWGSVWYKKNCDWMRTVFQTWHRRLPKGYLWLVGRRASGRAHQDHLQDRPDARRVRETSPLVRRRHCRAVGRSPLLPTLSFTLLRSSQHLAALHTIVPFIGPDVREGTSSFSS
jgi:hypothetical protein